MPDEKPKLDWKAAEDYLNDIIKKTMEYHGKNGHNPTLSLTKRGIIGGNIKTNPSLQGRLKNGEKTEDLYRSIFAVKFVVPACQGMKEGEQQKV